MIITTRRKLKDGSKKVEYRVALLLPIAADYSDRLKDDAMRYISEHPHLSLLDKSFYPGSPPSLDSDQIDFDAAILWLSHSDDWVDPLVDTGIPVINTSAERPRDDIPRIRGSTEAVSRKAIEHLSSIGSERVVFVNFNIEANQVNKVVADAFLDQAALLGVPATCHRIGAFTDSHFEDHATNLTAEMERGLKGLLESLPPKTGILCGNDYLGYHVCRLAHELGILVPMELAVMGKFNYRIALLSTPPLTSIPHAEGFGYEAMAMLDAALTKGAEIPNDTIIPPSDVVWRESTGGGNLRLGYLKKACRLIEERACEGISAAGVARELGISPQDLNYHFKQNLKITPGDLIAQKKINVAKQNLKTTSLPIAQVANLSGYNQQSKFTRFFKKRVGCTPMKYRKM